jgi:hypothetical protein
MSLPSDVAASLRAAGTALPLAEVRRAAQEVDVASRRLAMVAGPVPALNAALEHLDSAAGALLLAQHALQGYLAAVGVLPEAVPSTVDDQVRPDWWAARVFELTGITTDQLSTVDGGGLLDEAVARAQDGDRPGLASVLAGAEPSVGLGLASAAAPFITRCALLLDEPWDAVGTVRDLLPGLPYGVAEKLLAGTPHGPWDGHPADPAIAAPVLLAGLLNLLGRKGIHDH